jgi:hypothetical protein
MGSGLPRYERTNPVGLKLPEELSEAFGRDGYEGHRAVKSLEGAGWLTVSKPQRKLCKGEEPRASEARTLSKTTNHPMYLHDTRRRLWSYRRGFWLVETGMRSVSRLR